MAYGLVIIEEAAEEITDAYLWYEEQQKGIGEKFLSALDECFHRILKNPELYPKKYKEFRQAPVENFPFVVIYEIEINRIVVYVVFHTSREPGKKFRKA